MEKYIWQGSVSQKNLQSIVERTPGMKLDPEAVQLYAQTIERFHNEGINQHVAILFTNLLENRVFLASGEDVDKLNDYKQSVKRLLGLKN